MQHFRVILFSVVIAFIQCCVGSHLIAPLRPTRWLRWVFRSVILVDVILPMYLFSRAMDAELQGLHSRAALMHTAIGSLWFPLVLLVSSPPDILVLAAPVLSATLLLYAFRGLRHLAARVTESARRD